MAEVAFDLLLDAKGDKDTILKIQQDLNNKLDAKVREDGTWGPETVSSYFGPQLIEYLKDNNEYGLEDHQIKAMVGNFAHESMGFTAMEELAANKYGTKGINIAQWTDVTKRNDDGSIRWESLRRTAFENFAKENNLDANDPKAGAMFLMEELGNSSVWSNSKTLEGFKKTQNVEEATKYFMDGYLNPAKKTANYDARLNYAKNIGNIHDNKTNLITNEGNMSELDTLEAEKINDIPVTEDSEGRLVQTTRDMGEMPQPQETRQVSDIPYEETASGEIVQTTRDLGPMVDDARAIAGKKEGKVGQFDLASYLEESDLSLYNIDSEGNMIVEDLSGERFELDKKSLSKELGAPLDKLDVLFNEPPRLPTGELNPDFKPVQRSPIAWLDRVKGDVGNEKGFAKYLKNKFEDTYVHPEFGIVVKNNGVWQQADPSMKLVGDGWQITEELLGDTGELTREAMDVGFGIAGGLAGAKIGATIGTALFPGVGTAVGAVAGGIFGRIFGAAAAKGSQVVLGRYVGTYDATDEEVMKEAATEVLIASAAEAIVPGGKAVASVGKKGFKFAAKKTGLDAVGDALTNSFRNISRNASEGFKDVYATASAFLAGAPKEAADDMINMIDDVDSMGKKIIAHIRSKKPQFGKAIRPTVATIEESVEDMQIKNVGKVMKGFKTTLQNKFGALEKKLISNSRSFFANLHQNVDDGLAPLVRNSDNPNGILALSEDGYELLDKDTIGEMLTGIQGNQGSPIKKQALDKLEALVDIFNKTRKQGVASGGEGAKQALAIRRQIDDVMFSLEGSSSEGARQLHGILKTGFLDVRNNVVENFTKNNEMGSIYKEMNKLYTDNLEPLRMAEKFLNARSFSVASPEAGMLDAYRKMVSNSTTGRQFQRNLHMMTDFFADGNQSGLLQTVKDMRALEAAKYYTAFSPKLNNLAGGAALALGAASGALGEAYDIDALKVGGLALGASVSPRINRMMTKGLFKTGTKLNSTAKGAMLGINQLTKSLTRNQLNELYENPDKFLQMFAAGLSTENADDLMRMFQESQEGKYVLRHR